MIDFLIIIAVADSACSLLAHTSGSTSAFDYMASELCRWTRMPILVPNARDVASNLFEQEVAVVKSVKGREICTDFRALMLVAKERSATRAPQGNASPI